jgi:hypothetical protein
MDNAPAGVAWCFSNRGNDRARKRDRDFGSTSAAAACWPKPRRNQPIAAWLDPKATSFDSSKLEVKLTLEINLLTQRLKRRRDVSLRLKTR